MSKLDNISVGDLGRGLARYRAFAAVLVAAFLMVAVTAPGDDEDQAATARLSTEDTAELAVGEEGTAPSSFTDGSATATDPGAATATTQALQAGGAGAPTGASAGPAVTNPTGARVPAATSGDALAAPDCDRDTGYLRMKSKVWNLPCVPLWTGGTNNGGATSRGVTADKIKIIFRAANPADDAQASAYTAAGIGDTSATLEEDTRKNVALFARHAELYGRKIELIKSTPSGSTPEAARADAIADFNKHQPFAVITGSAGCDYQYQMALRGVVSICSSDITQAKVKQAAPFLWSSPCCSVLTAEQFMVASSEYIGKRLKGRPAKWAQDPVFKTQPRKFGWLYPSSPEFAPAKKVFEAEMARYGVEIAVSIGMTNPTTDATAFQDQVRTAVAKLKQAGVNTVIPDVTSTGAGLVSKEATNQGYLPEWISSGYGYSDATIFIRLFWDLNQARALHGVREQAVVVPKEKGDAYQLFAWENGAFPKSNFLFDNSLMPNHWTMFAGLHLAGPNLTPATFQNALFGLKPLGGVSSGSVASVEKSFGNRGIWPWEKGPFAGVPQQPDFTGTDDVTYTWFSATEQGPDETGKRAPGVMMFPDGAKRYRVGSLPTTEPPMFIREGALPGELPDLPAAERPREYPNKKGCATRTECSRS